MPELGALSGMYPNTVLNNVVLGIPTGIPSIVDDILPIVSSPITSFDIIKLGDDANQYEEDDLVANGGTSNEIDYSSSKTKGYVIQRGLKRTISQEDIEQAHRLGDYFRVGGVASTLTRPEVLAEIFVRNRVLKGREVRGARLIQSGANYPAGNVNTTFNAATGDLEAQFDTARSLIKASIASLALTGWMSWDVWLAVKKNPIIRGRLFGTAGGGLVTEQLVAGLLGLDKLLIGSGVYRTKVGNGLTAVRTSHDIWTQTMGLLYTAPNPEAGEPSFGYQFTTPYEGIPAGNNLATGVSGAGTPSGFGGTAGQQQLGMAFQEAITELRMAFYYRERVRGQLLQPEAGYIWTGVALA